MVKEYKNTGYLICDTGKIFSKKNHKEMKTQLTPSGYKCISLRFEPGRYGKTTKKLINRLVYETFKGEIPEGMKVDHIDEDKLNNNINNLQLLTNGDNIRKSAKKGKKGSKKRKIICIFKNGDEKLFDSMGATLEFLGSNPKSTRMIKDVINGKTKSQNGDENKFWI